MISAPRDLGGLEDFRLMVRELTEDKALKVLKVHRTTLRRWLGGYARVPHCAVLALYWQTHWGRGVIDSDRQYLIHLLNLRISGLIDENNRLVKAMAEYETMGAFDSANSPVYKHG